MADTPTSTAAKIISIGSLIGQAAAPGIGQANLILSGIIQGLTLYRQLRDAWRAAHPASPDSEGGWLPDDQLIDLLQKDSVALVSHAEELLLKYAPSPSPPKPVT